MNFDLLDTRSFWSSANWERSLCRPADLPAWS